METAENGYKQQTQKNKNGMEIGEHRMQDNNGQAVNMNVEGNGASYEHRTQESEM